MPKRPAPPSTELDISWRTRELGPEMRRELFRKAVPSVKLASQPDDEREQHADARNDPDRRRPRGREGAPDGNGKEARSAGPKRTPDHSS